MLSPQTNPDVKKQGPEHHHADLSAEQADVNQATSDIGTALLLTACIKGDVSIVEALLGQGVDANQTTTTDGTTPLLIAIQQGHGSIVKALLGQGADVNKASTDNGTTPLLIA